MDYRSYHDQIHTENTLKLRQILKSLPPFASDYFRAMEPTTSVKTRISYAYDIRVFFHFLIEANPVYKNHKVIDFQVTDLDRVEAVDLEEYQEYLNSYLESNGDMSLEEMEKYTLETYKSDLKSLINETILLEKVMEVIGSNIVEINDKPEE